MKNRTIRALVSIAGAIVMTILVLIVAALLCKPVYAVEYEFDAGITDVEYSWYSSEIDNAKFSRRMDGIGVTAHINDNWGVRLGYMKGGTAGTTGYYESFTVDMKSITSFEVIYKKKINDNFSIIAGVGSYLIPVPLTSEERNFFKDDRDDDEGYFVGFNARLYKDLSLTYKFTKFSTIDITGGDEGIKGNSLLLKWEF